MEEIMRDNIITDQQKELATYIEKFSEGDGIHPTGIESLHLIRASQTSEPIHSIHEPAICIVAQGKKVVRLAQDSYHYDTAQYLVVSVDLPISGEIIEATPDSPYLCLRLDFNPEQIFHILNESKHPVKSKGDSQLGLYVNKMDTSLLDAVLRLVHLLDSPEDIPSLAPLVIREILYRILKDEHGASVKQIAMAGSHTQRISKVIRQIKQDYDKPLRIEELAASSNLSTSSLHHHFKKVTRLSPLQYQKQIRLQEARRLLLSGVADAGDAAFQVGYESPSQFSREYARMFGLPPISDVRRLRGS